MPPLYAQHKSQLDGLKRSHEINRIENLKVERVDLVNVRYTEKAGPARVHGPGDGFGPRLLCGRPHRKVSARR